MNNIKAIVKNITIDEDEGFIVTGQDNLEVLKQLPDDCIDNVYIDPPYNTGKKWSKNEWEFDDKFPSKWDYLFFLGERLVEAKRVMNEGASIFLHCDYRMNSEIKSYLLDPLFNEKESMLSWRQVNIMLQLYLDKKCHKPVTIKPVNITPGPSICLDFFAGSLAYPLACKRLGRRYIGIELNKTETLWDKSIIFGQDK